MPNLASQINRIVGITRNESGSRKKANARLKADMMKGRPPSVTKAIMTRAKNKKADARRARTGAKPSKATQKRLAYNAARRVSNGGKGG